MHGVFATALCFLLALPACGSAEISRRDAIVDLSDYKAMRMVLLESIRDHTKATAIQTGVPAIDNTVMDVIARIPRHEFVPEPLRKFAYLDVPLPLGHKQKISQPFLIALMTHIARVQKTDVVFETGTGAGYQAAILAELAATVYSVEVVRPLAQSAAVRLKKMGIDKVQVKAGDGYYGWPEKGPFDVIIVKEAVHHIPPPLLNQMKPGGRMVVPVGPLDQGQILKLVTKGADGVISQKDILPVRFAPLQGGERI